MMLKQLQSDYSPNYLNPSEPKNERTSLYRCKSKFDAIVFDDERIKKSRILKVTSHSVIDADEKTEEISFVDEDDLPLIPRKSRIKPIPVTVKIQLSQSLTDEYLANPDLFNANRSLPVIIREKKTVVKNPNVLLDKIEHSSPKIWNFRSKQPLKQIQNLENSIVDTTREKEDRTIVQSMEIKTEKVSENIESIILDVEHTATEKDDEINSFVQSMEIKTKKVTNNIFEPKILDVELPELPDTASEKEDEINSFVKIMEIKTEKISKNIFEPKILDVELPELNQVSESPKLVELQEVIDKIAKLSEITIKQKVPEPVTVMEATEILNIAETIKVESEISSDTILNNNNSNSRNNNSFGIGELFWAKLGKSAPWPSIVVNPVDVSTNIRKRSEGIHVRFFNDAGRRGIVSRAQITPYIGLEAFLKTVSFLF